MMMLWNHTLMSAKGETRMRNAMVHIQHMHATLHAMEHVLQLVPLDWWVKGDDSTTRFAEPIAPQVKLKVDSYVGHDMSVEKCLPRQGLGGAEGNMTNRVVGPRQLKRAIGNLRTGSPQTSELRVRSS